MDDRTSGYGPLAMMAGATACVVSSIIKSRQGVTPNFNALTVIVEKNIDHWSIDDTCVGTNISRSNSAIPSIILLVAFTPITILSAFAVFCAVKELRARARTLSPGFSVLRLVLVLVFSLTAWAAIKPEDWFDCCALMLLLLLLGWKRIKYPVWTGHQRVWATVKHEIGADHWHVWHICLGAALVVLLLLATWLWPMKASQTQVCCRNTCNITTYFIPALLLLTSWIVRKLWIQASHRRRWEITVSIVVVALLFLALWAWKTPHIQACSSSTCDLKGYLGPVLLLTALLALKKLCTWVPRRRLWKIVRSSELLPVLLLLLWMIDKLQTQASYCCVLDQTVYLALLVSSLSAPWLTRILRIRTYDRQLLSLVVRIISLPVRVVTFPSQDTRYGTRGVGPADERLAILPIEIPKEEQFMKDQNGEMQRVTALNKYHKVLNQLSQRITTAEISRLQHELSRTISDAKTASSIAAAESGRLTTQYEHLVTSAFEALDPNGIYRSSKNIQYVVRRVKDRIAQQMHDLELKEKALKGSSIVKAAEAATKEAYNAISRLKVEHNNELTDLESQNTSMQLTLATKDMELRELIAAKANADKSSQAEKVKLKKALDDMKAAQQKQFDKMDVELRKEVMSKEGLQSSKERVESQLAGAECRSTELQQRVRALEDSEKKAKDDLNAKIQECHTLEEASKASALAHTKDLEAAESRANDLEVKLNDARAESESVSLLKQKIETLDLDLSAATSAYSTQAKDLAAGRQRLVEEHNAAMAAEQTKYRKTLEREASEKEETKNAHVAAIAAKDLEIQALKQQVARWSAQNDSQHQPSLADMDIDSAGEADAQGKDDQLTRLGRELAAESARVQSLEQTKQQLEQTQQQQREALEAGSNAYQSLQAELGVAGRKLEGMENIIRSGNQRMEEMDMTLETTKRTLETAQKRYLDADTEVECQKDDIEAAKKEAKEAQESSRKQQVDIKELQATIKTLRDELQKKEHSLKVTATEHNASEYQAVYADLERAKDLLDEIVDAGCDEPARMVLQELAIANGTIVEVAIELKRMDDNHREEQAWHTIHEELSRAIIGEQYLSSLSVANNRGQCGHPRLLKQAHMANMRLRRLIRIVEEEDADAKKNHVLAVMVLPRGDEGNDEEGKGPDSSSPGDAAGGNASKKRRSDDGMYSRPGGSSPSSTDKHTNQSSGFTSMKTASGEQPIASGFRLDPGHSFDFSFEHPEALGQRPPSEHSISNVDWSKLGEMAFGKPSVATEPVFSFGNPFPNAGQLAGIHGQNTQVGGLSLAELVSPLSPQSQDQELEEVTFDEPNFQDEMWNKGTEYGHMDPQVRLDASGDFMSLATPLDMLDDAGDAALEASQAAEYLQRQRRLQDEVDAEDREAGIGLYSRAETEDDNGAFYESFFNQPQDSIDLLEDQEYHAMVNSGYGNHIADGWKPDDKPEDDNVEWEDALRPDGEENVDFDWPETFSAGQPPQQQLPQKYHDSEQTGASSSRYPPQSRKRTRT